MGMLAPPLNLPWAPAFAPSRRRTRTRRPQWRSRSADRARKSSNRQVPPRRDIGRSLKRPVLKDNGGTAHRVPGSERRTPKTARPRRAWKLRRGRRRSKEHIVGDFGPSVRIQRKKPGHSSRKKSVPISALQRSRSRKREPRPSPTGGISEPSFMSGGMFAEEEWGNKKP
jgi:hypothetical protein